MEKNIDTSNFIEFQLIRDSVSFENNNLFNLYLADVYRDLSVRAGKTENIDSKSPTIKLKRSFTFAQTNTMKGIDKITFNNYIKIPVFISEKLFSSLDKDGDDCLNENEFYQGFTKLYLGNFNETAEIIFNIYDYDKDGVITSGDVKVLLSYLPLKTSDNREINIEYKNQMKGLEELDKIIQETFGSKGKNLNNSLNFDSFLDAIQNIKSDIYIHLLCFLYENKPFTLENINNYKNHRSSLSKKFTIPNTKKPNIQTSTMLPLPCKQTNIAATEKYIKDFVGKMKRSESTVHQKSNKVKNNLIPIPMERQKKSVSPTKIGPRKDMLININPNLNSPSPTNKKSPEISKEMIRMSNQKIIQKQDEDMTLLNLLETSKNIFDSPSNFFTQNTPEDFNLEELLLAQSDIVSDNEPFEKIYYEDWIYKDESTPIDPNKKAIPKTLNKYYMVILGKEISLFQSEKKDNLIHFHNLSGCFLKINNEIVKDKVSYYSFSIIFSKNITKTYYTTSQKSKSKWIEMIKKAIGYQQFTDYYQFIENVDEGRFGVVKLGVHKETGEKVAIKVINKTKLTDYEYELVRRELDVMKLFRHPNIVRLLDHFENDTFIYIVMEYLSGGHLIKHLERKNFQLSEKEAARIIYAIAQGIKYINSFGIIHRDIKPENIMLADLSENANIKIIDFGLTKTLAPDERLAEGMGTITFVAPEVIQRKPYNKQIDMWSLGVLLYLLLSGSLPFDDESLSEEIITKKIVFLDLLIPDDKFSNRSKDAILVIESCLDKNPEKRITVEELLKNDWIKSNK